jgi:cell fate regulator YaaT (PSP1 superfamily)
VELSDGTRVVCRKPAELAMAEGDACVLQADRVPEFGRVTRIQEGEPANLAGKDLPVLLRRATLQDQAKAKENALFGRMAKGTCTEKARKFNLPMKLVRLRYSFDRSVLHVMFSSEERLDFREMAKELASELKARIELRQLGVRDESAIVGGVGPCGRQLCCCSWLKTFESINVKMAKTQHISLNPNAISGMCGRLKCCLRYEFETYRELSRALPREGAIVKAPEGEGEVIEVDVLRQRVRVRMDGNRVLDMNASEVQTLRLGRPPRGGEPDEGDAVPNDTGVQP